MRSDKIGIALGLVVLIVGIIGYFVVFPAQPVRITVVSLSGEAQIIRDGQEQRASVGSQLRIDDGFAVDETGRAALQIGRDSQLEVMESTRIRIVNVADERVQIEIDEGQVRADVRTGQPIVSILHHQQTVENTSQQPARFVVSVDNEDALTVRAEDGSLTLNGFAEQTALVAGQQLHAFPGEQTVVQTIPQSLLLAIAWPDSAVVREDELVLEAETQPYASVVVTTNSTPQHLRASADGHVLIPVVLAEGQNTVAVTVADGMGEQVEAQQDILRQSTPPPMQVEASWGN